MKKIKFELNDYYDILNLYKALMEAKFNENPDNIYVSRSPIISRIINELVDILSNYDTNKSEDWNEWRKLEKHNCYIEKVIKLITKFVEWKEFSINQKMELLFNYLSPFIYTEKDIIELINEIDLRLTQ